MTQARFKIVFNGELMPDASLDTAKENLARLFKSDQTAFCKVVGASAVFLSCYFQCRLLPLWVERDGADGLPIPRRA